MKTRLLMTTIALAVMSIGGAMAQDAAPATIYGSQLMTRQERMEYRNQMRTLKTQQERNAFRLEHHTRMQERAKERGMTLPDTPPAAGGGMGPGRAAGGMGMGGPGMGGGRGRGAP
ncbi:MAG: hypothetical protein HZA64_02865 [Rhodocyclales bacterium]|nr:hypothetical protein [Rhodocyclales bacterium]